MRNVMRNVMRSCALLLCVSGAGHAIAQAAVQEGVAATTVVRSRAQWQAVLASGRKTPLDALTPHGKQEMIDALSAAWTERGLTGLPTGPLLRELERDELRAVLAFLDSDDYAAMLERRLAGPPLRLPAPSDAVARDLRHLKSTLFPSDPSQEASDAVSTVPAASLAAYLALFGGRMKEPDLRRRQSGDLLPLFDAAASTNIVHPGSPAYAHLLRVHAEFVRRGIDTRRTLDDTVFQAMVAAREFGQARAFAAGHPHLAAQAVPAVVDAIGPAFSGRSVFEYDQTRHTLTRKAFPQAGGAELVMVVNAGCQPSRRALDAIRSDPVLRARLQQANLTIIVPPSAAIPFPFVADWNGANPATPIRIPFSLREWAGVDTGAVPMFFLMKDGRVAGRVTGWPPEGNRAALLDLLDGVPTAIKAIKAGAPEG